MHRTLLPLMLFVGTACQPCDVEQRATTAGPDVEAITIWFERYVATVNAGDLEAWASFVADDAVILPPDGLPVGGMDRLRPMIKRARTGVNADPRLTMTRSLLTMSLALAAAALLSGDEADRTCKAQRATTDQPRDSVASGWIAFTSNRDGNHDIYTMDADGSNLNRFTSHPARDTDPAWSPDGTEMAFASNRDGNLEIYLKPIDGTGSTRLTDSASEESRPSWSPDGTRLVFHARSPRDSRTTSLYSVNVDGSARRKLSASEGDGSDPAWSPDGKLIALNALRGDGNINIDIFVINTDGSGRRRTTAHEDHDDFPTWSPDGARIAS